MTLKIVSDATGGRIQNETPIDAMTVGAGGAVSFAGAVKQGTGKKIVCAAIRTSQQAALAINTFVKVAFDSAILNPNTGYSTANSRFTPDVAGWYMVAATVTQAGTQNTDNAQLLIYKNGANHRRLSVVNTSSATHLTSQTSGSALVYLNGSGDYVEIFMYRGQSSGTASVEGEAAGTSTHFSVALMYPD